MKNMLNNKKHKEGGIKERKSWNHLTNQGSQNERKPKTKYLQNLYKGRGARIFFSNQGEIVGGKTHAHAEHQ